MCSANLSVAICENVQLTRENDGEPKKRSISQVRSLLFVGSVSTKLTFKRGQSIHTHCRASRNQLFFLSSISYSSGKNLPSFLRFRNFLSRLLPRRIGSLIFAIAKFMPFLTLFTPFSTPFFRFSTPLVTLFFVFSLIVAAAFFILSNTGVGTLCYQTSRLKPNTMKKYD